jgi:hypothetical protein
MDLTMIDVTELLFSQDSHASRVPRPDIADPASRIPGPDFPVIGEGTEVVVFDDGHPVSELAEAIGTIPYEVLTGISRRVKRIYYYE